MMKTKTAVLLVAAACAVLPACNKIDPGTPGKVEAAELVPIELTEVEQAVNVASNAFGLKLFRELQEEGKNMAISPLSISLALSMAAEGADGDTYAEMARVLGWGIVFPSRNMITAPASIRWASSSASVSSGMPMRPARR